ncbi:hypothetical protein [Streptomyces sp. CFMR 7]|uniref:hypothetical protein n=1 Tax=Streptomyces sp. CFMR 7 TaxID=1649184 RepID=UPI0011A53189|nr:hypothetical protein [Streptomyces sp. CFMR 7]
MTVTFTCNSEQEANVVRNSVNLYGRVVLPARGIDPRNYAPADENGAGFGWEAVRKAAYDMGRGSITHMSSRIAEAIEDALIYKAENGSTQTELGREFVTLAKRLSRRMASCIKAAEK